MFDTVSQKALTAISLPAYRLHPGTKYYWTVTHTGSAGQIATSDESTFRSPGYTIETVPFDLTEYFNIDVIANPGDEQNGTVDGGWSTLVVDGYDGTPSPYPKARGLPPDRRLGIHHLGDYDHDNAIQMGESDGSRIRVEVSPRRYAAIRFLLTCGWGRATVPTRLEYADGSFERRTLVGNDWGATVVATGQYTVEEGNVPIRRGLYRMLQGRFDSPRWSLYEVCLEVDPKKELVAFVLEGDQMRGSSTASEETRFNLFAATGVWVEE